MRMRLLVLKGTLGSGHVSPGQQNQAAAPLLAYRLGSQARWSPGVEEGGCQGDQDERRGRKGEVSEREGAGVDSC